MVIFKHLQLLAKGPLNQGWVWWRSQWPNLAVIGVASVVLSSGVAGLGQLGVLESLEQKAYDQMMRLRQTTRSLPPDDRLLIVTVTEEDLETLAEFPLTDGTVAQAIDRLQAHDPIAIGLDIFRAIPKPPGRADLARSLQADNVVVIAQLSNTSGGPGIPPPAEVEPTQVSFNDVVVDADGTIRRALLIAEPIGLPEHPFLFSFSLQLAMRYLATQNIVPEASDQNSDYMQLGEATLWPLQAGAGGYAVVDNDGYQVMLDYRDQFTPAREVTLQAVLNDQVDPAWIRDKIVLIGVTAPSFKDLFYTPFTAGVNEETHQMPGVVIHAQMVSQWLDIAMGDRPLMGLSQPWQEWLWCLGWALLGGTLAWYLHHPITLTVSEAGVFIAVAVSSYGLFITQGWVPVVAPGLTVLGTSGVVLAYQAQQSQRQRQMMQVLLGQTASPEVAKALWDNRDRLIKSGKLPGQSMVATMMFTDLRGFSTLAETTPPEQLLEWLNHYLEAMAEEIQAHHGIINKFTGDGLLGAFGVPIASTTPAAIAADAQASVACALSMAARLATINQERQQRHLPRLEMRVGIFTGPVVVGSLGGHHRMEYGIIGDSVNIASRLESFDKSRQPNHCRILIGQDTLNYLADAFVVEAWGDLVLKGRHAPIGVHRVIAHNRSQVTGLNYSSVGD